jgi:hypothetical protein
VVRSRRGERTMLRYGEKTQTLDAAAGGTITFDGALRTR